MNRGMPMVTVLWRYRQRSAKGSVQQGWKDSNGSSLMRNGAIAEAPNCFVRGARLRLRRETCCCLLCAVFDWRPRRGRLWRSKRESFASNSRKVLV